MTTTNDLDKDLNVINAGNYFLLLRIAVSIIVLSQFVVYIKDEKSITKKFAPT